MAGGVTLFVSVFPGFSLPCSRPVGQRPWGCGLAVLLWRLLCSGCRQSPLPSSVSCLLPAFLWTVSFLAFAGRPSFALVSQHRLLSMDSTKWSC